MFTVLWKVGPGQEEIFETASIAKIPKRAKPSEGEGPMPDCEGRPHISFQSMTAVENDGVELHFVRTVIDVGEIFIMNGEGKTVASYRLEAATP